MAREDSPTASHWKLTFDKSLTYIDRSLRHHGLELISPPLMFSSAPVRVHKAVSALNQIGARCTTSCGYHVHVDVDGLTPYEKFIVPLRYQFHRKRIDRMLHASRRGDCQMMAEDTAETLDDLFFLMRKGVFEKHRKVSLRRAFYDKPTIEFRQHQGSLHYEQIKHWMIFVRSFTLASRSFVPDIKQPTNLTDGEKLLWSGFVHQGLYVPDGIKADSFIRKIEDSGIGVSRYVHANDEHPFFMIPNDLVKKPLFKVKDLWLGVPKKTVEFFKNSSSVRALIEELGEECY
jgi:hypothetical protein